MYDIELSADGTFVRPSLHDGRVRGLLLCADKKVLLAIEATDGGRFCLAMHGVDRFRADDFWEGNIILDIGVYTGEQLDAEDVAFAFNVDTNHTSFLQQTVDRLRREARLLVKINPSYGVAVVCICSRLSVEEDRLPQ